MKMFVKFLARFFPKKKEVIEEKNKVTNPLFAIIKEFFPYALLCEEVVICEKISFAMCGNEIVIIPNRVIIDSDETDDEEKFLNDLEHVITLLKNVLGFTCLILKPSENRPYLFLTFEDVVAADEKDKGTFPFNNSLFYFKESEKIPEESKLLDEAKKEGKLIFRKGPGSFKELNDFLESNTIDIKGFRPFQEGKIFFDEYNVLRWYPVLVDIISFDLKKIISDHKF
jgi:hypothetical protein